MPSRPIASFLVSRALLAVFLSGFGGLLFEILSLRMAALYLGQGSQAQGFVLAAFLLGLGVGGKRASQQRNPKGRLLKRASRLYLLVAFLLPLLPFAALQLHPGDPLLGPLFFLGVGVPAVFMGEAFPLCITALQGSFHRAAFFLNGSNLLGSCLGLGLGALAMIPLLGIRTSLWLAVSLYALSFFFLLGLRNPIAEEGQDFVDETQAASAWEEEGRGGKILIVAGAALLLLEIWLPRRLSFSFGSFLPTQAGSLLGLLLGLALGSFLLGFRDLGRRLGPSWMGLFSLLGVLLSMVLVESFAGDLAGLSLESLSGALFGATVYPGLLLLPASLPLGGLIPAWISRRGAKDGAGESIAGKAFFLFSMGAALVGLGSPLLFALPLEAWGLGSPLRFMPLLAAGFLALGLGRFRFSLPLTLATLFGLGFFFNNTWGTPLLWEARNFDAKGNGRTVLSQKSDRITTASVVLDRVRGERFLYTDEFSAAGGVESRYMEALGILPVWLSETRTEKKGAIFACLGLGTGRTAAALLEANRKGKTWILEISSAVASQLPFFLDATGTREAFAKAGALENKIMDGRFFLEQAKEGSLGGVTLEPLLPQAPGSVYLYSLGFYRAGREALAKGGVLVQWVPTHALPLKGFQALLRTFGRVFKHPRLLLVQESSLLLGKKGGLEGAIPDRRGLGDRAAFLSGLFQPLDLALAELPFPQEGPGPLVDEERPFLERMGFEPARIRLGWLAGNLRSLQGTEGVKAQGMKENRFDTPSHVQRERLAARLLLARRFEDPNVDAAGMAARRLMMLRERFPTSTLLLREERKARYFQEKDRAWRALLSHNPGLALKSAERALRLGPCDPVLLSIRAAALLELRGKRGAKSALMELLRFYPMISELRAIQKRAKLGFTPLLEALATLPQPTNHRDPSLPPSGFFEKMERGDSEALFFLRRRPLDAMWILLHSLRKGKNLGPKALRHMGPYLDPASLVLLEPWMARNASNLYALMRVLPMDLVPTKWMQKKLLRDSQGFELLLRFLERKGGPWPLHVLLDVLATPGLERSRLIRCSLAWQRLHPDSAPLSPTASEKARIRWALAKQKDLPPTWNHGFTHKERFLEWN